MISLYPDWAGNFAVDLSMDVQWVLHLQPNSNGNTCVVDFVTGPVVGPVDFFIIQTGGNITLTWGGSFIPQWVGGSTPVITPTAGQIDWLRLYGEAGPFAASGVVIGEIVGQNLTL